MKQLIGIILIVIALVLGYEGIRKLHQSQVAVNILGIKFSAEDSESKTTAYVEIVIAVVVLLAGVSQLQTKRRV